MTSIQTSSLIDVMDQTLDAKLAYPGTLSHITISRPIFSYISRSRKDTAFIFSNVIIHILKQLLTRFQAKTQQIADFGFSTYRIFSLCKIQISKFSACKSNFSGSRFSIDLILGNLFHQYLKQLLTDFQTYTPQIPNFDISTRLDLHASSFNQILKYKFQIFFTFSAEA